jgi:hypothetical protein
VYRMDWKNSTPRSVLSGMIDGPLADRASRPGCARGFAKDFWHL